jgi:lipid-binding SYLF domain-containing protein
VSVDGSVLDVRQGLNSGYYGQAATPLDILVKRAVTNPDSTSLQAAVADAAK